MLSFIDLDVGMNYDENVHIIDIYIYIYSTQSA